MERAEGLVALGDAAQDVKVAAVHLVTGLQIDYGPLCPQEHSSGDFRFASSFVRFTSRSRPTGRMP